MAKKFEDSGYYLRSCECNASKRERLSLAVISVEYPPILLTSIETGVGEGVRDRKEPGCSFINW
jgi:hypothetical protein